MAIQVCGKKKGNQPQEKTHKEKWYVMTTRSCHPVKVIRKGH